VATRGEKAVNAFNVRDILENIVDMEFVKSMKSEMGAIDQIAIKNESDMGRQTSPGSGARPRFAIGDLPKFGIGHFSPNFISIR
jgi:hypothetical protein